jgi:hypothetical protein
MSLKNNQVSCSSYDITKKREADESFELNPNINSAISYFSLTSESTRKHNPRSKE